MKFSKTELWCNRSQVFFAFTVASVIAILLFYKRFIFPDVSFDAINYHFSLGWRGWVNFPFLTPVSKGEFFPLGMHSFNPIIDMIAVGFSRIVGYRLGTVVSLLALLGVFLFSAFLVVRLNRALKVWLVPFLFSIFIVNEAYFQIATYSTDNIFAFFAIVSLFILLKISGFLGRRCSIEEMSYIILFSFLLTLLSSKLTNAFYVIPLFLSLMYLFIKRKLYFRNWLLVGVVFLISFSLVILPNWVAVYQLSGNPIFPYYNSIFHSQFYPLESWPFNFGPHTILERVFYPFYALNNPYLLGEVKDFFPDLKLIYLFLIFCFLFAFSRFKKCEFTLQQKLIYFVAFASFLLWQFIFGYTRYAIALEIMLGVSIVTIVSGSLWDRVGWIFKFFTVAVGLFLIYISSNIVVFNFKHDLSWKPNIPFSDIQHRLSKIPLRLSETIVNERMKNRLENVDFVGQCANPSSAYIQTLEPLKNKIVLNFDVGSNGAMTKLKSFINHRNNIYLDDSKKSSNVQSFLMLFNNDNSGWNSRSQCLQAINEATSLGQDIVITDEAQIDNFVGDYSKKIGVFFGVYTIKNIK